MPPYENDEFGTIYDVYGLNSKFGDQLSLNYVICVVHVLSIAGY